MASQTKTPSGEESTLGSGTPDRAAWYPDPRGQGKLRWWDGSEWTENVHGTPAPEPETHRNGPDGEQPTDEVANVASEKLDRPPDESAASKSHDEISEPSGNGRSSNGAVEIPAEMVRVCPRCSVQAHTAGDYCPHCGAAYARRRGRIRRASRRTKIIVAAIVGLLLVGGAVTGVLLKIQHDNDVAAKHKQQQEQARQQAAAQAAAQQSIDQANQEKRTLRAGIVTSLQDSVTKDANKRIDESVLDGPAVTHTTCTPVGGGSTDDLTAHTGNFSCLAANKSNSDGTEEGYGFSATVNYDNGSYTWRLGN